MGFATRFVLGLVLAGALATLVWQLLPVREATLGPVGAAILEAKREPVRDRPASPTDSWRPPALPDGVVGRVEQVSLSAHGRAPRSGAGAPHVRIQQNGRIDVLSPLLTPPPWLLAQIELPGEGLEDLSPSARASLVELMSAWGHHWRDGGDDLLRVQAGSGFEVRDGEVRQLLRWRRR